MASCRPLSPEILGMIAQHLPLSSLGAFALSSRAFTRASDPFRYAHLKATNLPALLIACGALLSTWREVGRHVKEITFKLADEDEKMEALMEEAGAISSNSTERRTSTAVLLCSGLQKARYLTRLTFSINLPFSESFSSELLQSISSQVLQCLALDGSSVRNLSSSCLHNFLSRQTQLCCLSVTGLMTDNLSEDNRQDQYSIADSQSLSHPNSSPNNRLCRLTSVRAPISFILSLPYNTPLQHVMTTDDDIPSSLHRQFFERLACSPRRITRLWIQLSSENVRLGVMQEITKNLKDLELLCVRGIVPRAYFTYFLQDITGCLSRCKKLKALAFTPPTGSIPVPGTTHYVAIPNSDPSIPLPPLTTSNPSHPYPSSGPDLFRREHYIVNLYGSTNVALRNVRMPSGTQWKSSSHDDDDGPFIQPDIFDFDHDLCSQPLSPRFPSRRIAVPTLGHRDPSSQTHTLLSPPQVIILPAPVSAPPVQYRTPCWGWEPEVSCTDARRWWEEWGLKPPSPISSFDDSTEVESDDEDIDMSSEAGTDVDEVVKIRPGKLEESEPCQRLVTSQPKVLCCSEVSRGLVPSQNETRIAPRRNAAIIKRKTSEEEVEILL